MGLGHRDLVVKAAFKKMRAKRAAWQAKRPQIEQESEAALRRLFNVVQGDSGQCRYIARFLLGCYSGARFPFDLTDLRGLDAALFGDCLVVLKMEVAPKQEVHRYFGPDGGA